MSRKRKRENNIRYLSLPDSILQKYAQLDTNQEENHPNEFFDLSDQNIAMEVEVVDLTASVNNDPLEFESEVSPSKSTDENLINSKDVSSPSVIKDNKEIEHLPKLKKCSLKELSIVLDDHYDLQNKCIVFRKMSHEFLEVQDNIYKKIKDFQHNTKIFSYKHLVKTQLEDMINLIKTQRLTLINLEKKISDIIFSISIFNYPDIEKDKIRSLTVSLKTNENELKICKDKNRFLEKQVKNFKENLRNLKLNYRNHIHQKDRYILRLKKKLTIQRKRFKVVSEKDSKRSVQSIEIQNLLSVQNLMNSLINNVINNQKQNISPSCSTVANHKDIMINKLKNENEEKNKKINEKEAEIKEKDARIRQLILDKNRAKRQMELMREEKLKEDKQKDFEIKNLISTLENWQRKNDRWLIDRFYMKNHMCMLFQKLRQSEQQCMKNFFNFKVKIN